MDLKYILIKRIRNENTEQLRLDSLYRILDKNGFECEDNAYLNYIVKYLDDYKDNKESFCYSKKLKKIGMNTGYLIDNLRNTRKNSSIVIIDMNSGNVLGVLVFNYVHTSDKDYDYDNSLYVDSFCTNQQNRVSGIGKLLITSIIEATEEFGYIDNIFLNAATRDSEGFYERFNFEPTGRYKDKMKEYKYPIVPSGYASSEAEPSEAEPSEADASEAEAREAEARDDPPPHSMPLSKFVIPRSIPLPPYEMVSNPIKPTYIKIWSRGDNLRTSKNRLEQLEKVYGNDFDFTVRGRRQRRGQRRRAQRRR